MKFFLHSVITGKVDHWFVKPLKFILCLLSYVYLMVIKIRQICFTTDAIKIKPLPRPVISVGSITWGGVGKTPLVEWIAQYLKEEGSYPAILTRGYMAKPNQEADQDSDEAKMLKNRLINIPVLSGAKRYENAVNFLKENDVDVFILDDGFQHQQLKRDLDIVVIDSNNPFGNRQLIPGGILRERLTSLKRADVIVLTKTDLNTEGLSQLEDEIERVAPNKLFVESQHIPSALVNLCSGNIVDFEHLKGKKVCAFCGIGDPPSFVAILQKIDIEVIKNFTFMDHHIYTKQDLDRVFDYCRDHKIDTILTTEKDAVKLDDLTQYFIEGVHIYYLAIEITIHQGKEELLERITSVLHS